MSNEDARYLCPECWGFVDPRRVNIVPMPKSNYIVVTDPELLKGLNSSHKGGVR